MKKDKETKKKVKKPKKLTKREEYAEREKRRFGMGGRPAKFTSAVEMQSRIDEYFELCRINNKPLTMSGLGNSLGMNRQDILNYKKKDKFFDTITRAKEFCHQFAEESLFRPGLSPVGVMFNIKNNYAKDSNDHKWRDQHEVDHGMSDDLLKKFEGMSNDEVEKRAALLAAKRVNRG